MCHHAFNEEVQADKKVYDFIFIFFEIVEALSESCHL